MNTFERFKDSLFRFSNLHKAKNMPFWKVILYIVFLSMLLALPVTKQIFVLMQDIKNDGLKIAEKLPEFTIQDGKLTTEKPASGFIYQTDSIIFTFDPDGKRDQKDITADAVGNAMGLGLLHDELVIALPHSGTTDSLLGTNQFELSYAKGTLNGLTSKKVKQTLEQSTLPFWTKGFIFILTIYPTFINLIINLLLIAVAGSIYAKFRLYKLRFLDCIKIGTYAATLPVILSSILHFFNQSFDDTFLILFVSLLIFFYGIRKEAHE